MDRVVLAVNGTLMRGLELNPNMLTAGATFLREDQTAACYRIFAQLGWTVAEFEEIFRGKNKTFRDYKNNLFLITLGTRIFNLLGLDNRIFR